VIDFSKEQSLSLAEACGLVRGRNPGKNPSLSTLYRWTSKGLRGIRLESGMQGGATLTSKEAMDRFFQALNLQREQELGDPAPRAGRRGRVAAVGTRTPQRQLQVDAAVELARAELAPRSRP
jgi:hypothetical protein